MILELSIALNLLLLLISVATIISLKFQLSKVDTYERWIIDFRDTITNTLTKLETIDSAGTFRADDEVGYFFNAMKQILNQLAEYGVEELNDGQNQKKKE